MLNRCAKGVICSRGRSLPALRFPTVGDGADLPARIVAIVP